MNGGTGNQPHRLMETIVVIVEWHSIAMVAAQ